MSNESAQRQTASIVAAVTLSHHKVPGSGEAFLVEAKDEEEQKRVTSDIAKAVKGDVAELSNGIYLILKS
ncbi:hypothetical protein [Pelosinus sp. UFO1]|uniref:capping complex subunit for YIEGIA n=1 Tax=Pelosinus sp. UFO1 TaxID=484770 RepID=UPI0004D10AB1|nr:hypothetical protein [Pelosinus sp. UFO1]AIF49896.1 hypothetical protein UFO1_0335 [Pelosinus sp. UFO1]